MDAIAARQIASGSNNGAAATNDPVVGKAASKAANRTVPNVFIQSIDHSYQPQKSARSRSESVLLSLVRLEAESVCVHTRALSHRNRSQRCFRTLCGASILACRLWSASPHEPASSLGP